MLRCVLRLDVSNASLVVLALAKGDCAEDGIWPGTLSGKTAVLDCQGETIGKMTRECTSTGWKDADSTYCLPKYHTDDTKGYVDWVYRFTNAKYSGFKNDKNNQLVKAILSAYKTILNDGEVALYRISQGSITDSVDVQVRVDCAKSRANSLYKILSQETSETDRTKKPVLQIMKNKDAFIQSGSKDKADLIYTVNPTYNTVKPKNTTATVVWIVVIIIALIVLGFVGFYVWLQVKRSGSKNGSKQLKNTSKV